MKVFVVLSAVFACVLARPGLVPLAYTAPVAHVYTVPAEISSQYHAQDSLGQYSYGYADGLSAKSESQSFDRVTSGSYAYVDATGKLQHVSYVADPVHGFKVAASNLPVAPVPEKVEAPKPVEDTPEVAKAKADHLAAVEEAKARASAEPEEVEAVEVAAPEEAAAVPTVPASTVKVAAPVVTPVVTAYAAPAVAVAHPASYFSYSAVAPAYSAYTHYAPAVTSYAYNPVAYNAIPWAAEVAKIETEH